MLPTVVWARESTPPHDQPVLLWDNYKTGDHHPDTVSLPTYIEENAQEVRARLLAFVYEAKLLRSNGVTIEDDLRLHDDFSMWWLTFPSLKRITQQSIPVACRLIAIEMIIAPSGLGDVRIETDNIALAKQIHQALDNTPSIGIRRKMSLKRKFIHPARAFASLIRYAVVTGLSMRTRPVPNSGLVGSIAFFDYLSPLSTATNGTRSYGSPHWGEVPDLVENPSWYHVYPRNITYRGLKNAFADLDDLKRLGTRQHTLFLGQLTLGDIRQVLRIMSRQRKTHRRFDDQLQSFVSNGSKLRLWSVFTDEWDESLLGSTAIRHLLLLFSADSFFRAMPTYQKIYYLMENQPWELVLCHFAKKYDKGKTVGVAHSTVRFWDLRYFTDPRENPFVNPTVKRPNPNQILVNSEIAQRLLFENRFPTSSISLVEASRYNYVHDQVPLSEPHRNDIVILGDFDERANSTLFGVLHDALSKGEVRHPIKIRSHPICPLTDDQLEHLRSNLTSEPLRSLLKSAALVLTTSGSSSAAESVALGIPTVIVLDAKSLNYSPLRGTGMTFDVGDANELASILNNIDQLSRQASTSIFVVDPDYPRWKSHLISQ